MKIRVCVPFYSEFEAVKPGLSELKKDPQFEIELRQGTYIYELRNSLVADRGTTPVEGFSHFLFIDSDISFKAADVERLIEHDRDIVAAPYPMQNGKGLSAFKLSKIGVILDYLKGPGLKKVDACGTGFMLIKREVFEKLKYPWFYHPIINERVIGEDFIFCMDARKAGFNVWCDFDINLGHKIRKKEQFNWNLKKESIMEKKIPTDITSMMLEITTNLSAVMNEVAKNYKHLAIRVQELESIQKEPKSE